jgi:hypothetical protein
MQAGQSARQLARYAVVDRKTALRYFEAARACGVGPETSLDDGLVAEVASRVQARPEAPTSEPYKQLEAQRPRIEGWLRAERPLRLVRVRDLLAQLAHDQKSSWFVDEMGSVRSGTPFSSVLPTRAS